jgi:NADPH-dependent curcumin reductase CurA
LVAARRLGADRVAIVFAARDGDGTSFAPEGVPSVKLAPLSGESARALLAERVGAPMPDDVVDRLMTQAAGNPLALVELPTTLTGEQLTGAVPLPVSSASKADLVRSLGADHVIDYAREDFADGVRRYDLILDIAGNPSLARLRRALTPRGTAVLLGGEQGGGRVTGGFGRTLRAVLLSPFVSQRLAMVTSNENGRDLERLTALIEAGQVTPHVDRRYLLDDVVEAMTRLIDGEVRGKVAICI